MPQEIKNPFLHQHDHHHHDHDHDHDHDHGDGELLKELDPAQQSLADALRVSFSVLKVVMVLLLIAYVFSGVFTVDSSQAAVRLRFGKIVGEGEEQIYTRGLHFGWPYPIEQVIRVPLTAQQIRIDQAFWYSSTEQRALNPLTDGSLITGDANIVHGRWALSYVITDPALFVRNVKTMEAADALVRRVAERAIVHTVGQTTADAVIERRTSSRDGGEARDDPAMTRINRTLAELDAGIGVTSMSIEDTQMPPSVRPAYDSVNTAESRRAQRIDAAQQSRERILGETAGPAYEELFSLIKSYETARDADLGDLAQRLDRHLTLVLERLAVPRVMDADARPRSYRQVERLIHQHLQPAAATEGEAVAADDVLADLNALLDELELALSPAPAAGEAPAADGDADVEAEAEAEPSRVNMIALGGEVSTSISAAATYRTSVVERIRAEANTFGSLLEQYRHNPHILMTQLWQNAREEIFASDQIETFYTVPGTVYPVIGRDPEIRRDQERQRLAAEQEQRQQ